ncbi:hypothetical protein [Symbioplanes lichenis]|uniref:hypothetical protein n=1 Tax=Symbioplanes lichenis TaxID=1629072 RepID=UPI0027386B68|nr:hypothetical protein [Actinoplanes lichenis]
MTHEEDFRLWSDELGMDEWYPDSHSRLVAELRDHFGPRTTAREPSPGEWRTLMAECRKALRRQRLRTILGFLALMAMAAVAGLALGVAG